MSPVPRPLAVVVRNGALGDFVLTLPVIETLIARGYDVRVSCPARYGVLLPAGAQRLSGSWPFERTNVLEPSNVALAVGFSSVTDETLRALGIANVCTVAPWPPAGVHAREHYAGVLSPPAEGVPRVRVHEKRARDDAPICIAPGSGGREKRWPLERWCAVHTELLAARVPVVWVAGPDELDAEVWPVLPVAPELGDLCGLAAAAGCWLGPDSGPSHLAAATGVAVGVVFGPTDPLEWAPAGAQVFGWSVRPEDLAAWALAARTRALHAR